MGRVLTALVLVAVAALLLVVLLPRQGGEVGPEPAAPATGGAGGGPDRPAPLRGAPAPARRPEEPGAEGPARSSPGAAAKLPDLLRALKDPRARQEARQAIKRLGPAAVEPILAEVAKDDFRQGGPSWQAQATILLSELGPGAVPRLAVRLQDSSPKVRLVSVLALAHMGRQAAPARDALAAAAADPDPRVRLAAKGILDRLRPPAPEPEGPPARSTGPDGKEETRR